MQILPSQRLFGLPAVALRDFFVAHRHSYFAGFTYREFADRFKLKAADAKARMRAMAAAGYLIPPPVAKADWTYGPEGDRLSLARAVSKIPYAKAEQLLGDLLDRVYQVSQDPRFSHEVARLSVFGSYARGAAEVSDLDLVIELRWKRDEGTVAELTERALAAFAAAGRNVDFWNAEQRATEDQVYRFLKNRSRYLSPMNADELERADVVLVLYEALPLCQRA